MIEIIPAIMPKNFEDIKDKVGVVRDYVKTVQVDLCDGKFVHKTTWPFNDRDADSLDDILSEREGMPYWENINYELDLMVIDGITNFESYAKLGAKRIVFHVSENEIDLFVDFFEGLDMYIRDSIEIGIAFEVHYDIDRYSKIISMVDFVQCMGIAQIGLQGEPFDLKTLENIKILRDKFFDIIISVDGGVNLKSAQMLIEAGVDRLVVGSAIFADISPIDAILEFENLV